MEDIEKKIQAIEKIIDTWLLLLDKRPRMLGSILEIEGLLHYLYPINLILKYGVEYDDRDLYWQKFLRYKKIGGVTGYAYKTPAKRKRSL